MENDWNFSPETATANVTESIFKMVEKMNTFNLKEKAVLNFQKVNVESIPVLSKFLNRYPSHSCDFSIGGILMWADYFSYEYAIYDDTLFLKGINPLSKRVILYNPIGKRPSTDYHRYLSDQSELSSSNPVILSVVEMDYTDYCEKGREDCSLVDEWKEYVYPIEQFIDFHGKKMEKKRNHLNFFKKHYEGYSVEEISDSNIDELLQFSDKFEDSHEKSDIFINECEQTKEVIRNLHNYPFCGIILKFNDKVIGFSLAETIGDMCFVHIEKGDYNYQGVYQAISSEMAKYIFRCYPDVKYLNREEDMGMDSLRKSKESYHPSLIICKKLEEITL